PKRQLFYRSQINRLFRHDVYSTLKIQCVVSVMVNKQFGYGYLEEIVMRRADRQLYTFKEGDFINLHLNDIEEMLLQVKRLMRADELYKFLDIMLKFVRDTLHHRLLNFRLGYNKDMPRRKWTNTDQRQSGIMVNLIDKQLLERRIMLNLERLVGARELETDYLLMQWTI
ncbi:hypothetical protein Tco_0143791, partial [Tanacetum coccineum]